jgi:two-component system, OmpR family, response regulator
LLATAREAAGRGIELPLPIAALVLPRPCVRILLVEDNRTLSRSLRQGLEEEGYAVDVAYDGDEAAFKAEATEYDAVILDLMLPKQDGFSLIQRWRAKSIGTHILVLTARGNLEDKVRGLDLGADDYLTKPFELEELLARLRALVRRRHQVKTPLVKILDLEIDTAAHTARRGGKEIHLTPREYGLLEFLAFNRGKVVTRTMIWDHLYDEDDESTSNVVDVYIRYLRNKVDKGFKPALILTRWGEGYMMRGEEQTASETATAEAEEDAG